jgi:streptogrisin C
MGQISSRAITRVGTVATAAVLAAISQLALGGTANAAPGDSGATAARSDSRAATVDMSTATLAAMQHDLGLTADQVRTRALQEAKAITVDQTLRTELGSVFGGSWFDAGTGKLVVAVTDAGSVAKVTAAGAQARVVKYSEASLNSIKAELDAMAGKTTNSATRQAATAGAKLPPALAALTGWYVDSKTNSIVVTTVKGRSVAAASALLSKYGDAVRVEYLDAAPAVAANFLDGGDLLQTNVGSCSVGFNLRNPSTGQGYVLTAGHCGAGVVGTQASGQGGVNIGPILEAWFPTYDDAIIRRDNSYWIQGPWVDTNPSNGGVITVSGTSDSPVGTSVCKSGITTKLTCGSITAKDETVVYAQGAVYGMTRHSACVQPGDSGGSNYVSATRTAEGVTSGAILYGGLCGQKVGQPTVSWYFPIVDSLAYYGAVYGVTLW